MDHVHNLPPNSPEQAFSTYIYRRIKVGPKDVGFVDKAIPHQLMNKTITLQSAWLPWIHNLQQLLH